MVKRLDTRLEFDLNMKIIDAICDRKRCLPEQIFRQAKEHSFCLLFDEIFLPSFFVDMKEFLRHENEAEFCLIVLDPDPETYFFEHFGTYHLVSFAGDDSVEDYMALLNRDPGGSPADAIMHSSDVVLFYSATKRWAVYADRAWDIAVCWFANEETMKKFRRVYSGVVLDTVDDTLEFIRETFGGRKVPTEFEAAFRMNFAK